MEKKVSILLAGITKNIVISAQINESHTLL